MSAEQAGGTSGSGPVSDRMRALLSRAAEEQLHEQRQVSAVLGELRTLLEDVDERLATGEQLERVAGEVRELTVRLETRLDAADARVDELAERIGQATALVGQAVQDLVETVVAGVAERLEGQLGAATAGLASSVGGLVEDSERRLATHVDDAVLALAEVVLRRRHPAATSPREQTPPVPAAPAELDVEPTTATAPPEPHAAPAAGEDAPAATAPEPPPAVRDATADPVAPCEPAGPVAPGDGFVLVPADVEHADAQPAPPVPHERRTADRRGEQRSDLSGRRRRPWWRPA